MNPVKIIVTGPSGQMGRQIIASVYEDEYIELAGAVDRNKIGEDPASLIGLAPSGIKISENLIDTINNSNPDGVVDFTCHDASCRIIEQSISCGIPVVSGTTGFSEDELNDFHKKALEKGVALFIAPNFAIGAVLMMKFAKEASKYLNHAEIIELHHDKKKDAPSGTSISTAKGMAENISPLLLEEKVVLPGVRGGNCNGVKIHSVRLPGLVAHQQVLLGGRGEVLTICHDSLSRESFMPGVMMAIKKIKTLKPGLTFGLDKLLDF